MILSPTPVTPKPPVTGAENVKQYFAIVERQAALKREVGR